MRCVCESAVALSMAALLVGCAPKRPGPPDDFIGGCSHDNVLPELKLGDAHRRLLADRNDPPRTVVDHYLSLPDSFFGNVEDTTPERRISFIEMDTLTGQWLKAGHFFDCDGGGFEVVMRLFEARDGPLVAISAWESAYEPLYRNEAAGPDEIETITLSVPRFWRLRDGQWQEAGDVALPIIDKDAVLDRYFNHFRQHFEEARLSHSIWLQYELPKAGDEIRLTGRGNFMDPDGEYLWQRLRFDGQSFKELPLTD